MGVRSVVRRWLIWRLGQGAVLRSNFSQADQFRRIGVYEQVVHARFTKRQIIDREVLCDAIDALRLLGRWGFLSRNSQVRLAGTSLPEATFRSPHFQQYIFLLFLCPCALGE